MKIILYILFIVSFLLTSCGTSMKPCCNFMPWYGCYKGSRTIKTSVNPPLNIVVYNSNSNYKIILNKENVIKEYSSYEPVDSIGIKMLLANSKDTMVISNFRENKYTFKGIVMKEIRKRNAVIINQSTKKMILKVTRKKSNCWHSPKSGAGVIIYIDTENKEHIIGRSLWRA